MGEYNIKDIIEASVRAEILQMKLSTLPEDEFLDSLVVLQDQASSLSSDGRKVCFLSLLLVLYDRNSKKEKLKWLFENLPVLGMQETSTNIVPQSQETLGWWGIILKLLRQFKRG
jgi:hypothetical protein